MHDLDFVHWQNGEFWLGYWVAYPDHWTQGVSLVDLNAHLVGLLADLESGEIPGVRRVDER